MSKTVLLADDSVTFHKIVEYSLIGEGVNVIATKSAEEALAQARQQAPSLIIADTHMPGGRSGYDLAAAVRAEPQLSSVPVILLASKAAPFDEARAQQLGVAGHVAKPFQSQDLIDKVRQALSQQGGRRSAEAQHRAPTPSPGIPSAGSIVPPPPAPSRPPPSRTIPPPSRSALIPPAPAASQERSVPPPPRSLTGAPPPRPAQGFPQRGASIPPPPRPARPAHPGFSAPPPPRPGPTMPPPSRTVPPPARTVPPQARPMPPGRTIPPPPRARAPGPVAQGRPMAPGLSHPPPARPAGVTAANHEALLREALSKATREMIEKVVWEVVPDLAETLIREELERLLKERQGG